MEANPALAIGGLALAVPLIIDLLLAVAAKIGVAADHHIHIDDHSTTCRRLVRSCQGETVGLLSWFTSLWDSLPADMQEQMSGLQEELHSIYVRIAKTSPASSLADAGGVASSGRKPSNTLPKLSPWQVDRIEREIDRLEAWNHRLHLRAVEVLWFTPLHEPSRTQRQQLIHQFDTLDKVNRIREAVQNSLQQRPLPLTTLLIDAQSVAGVSRSLHSDIRDSSLYLLESPSQDTILVERRAYSDDAPNEKVEHSRKIVRDVASILHDAQPETMGISKCRGSLHKPEENRFELHFEPPPRFRGQILQSLRNLLKTSSQIKVFHSLSQRLRVARNMAAAVYFVHAGNFVHKNIRPDNILSSDHPPPPGTDHSQLRQYRFPRSLGEAYLVGDDGVRKMDAASSRSALEDPNRVIYTSPERAGNDIRIDVTMKHDVYSLGVVLLELGLWTDFADPHSTYGKCLWEMKDGQPAIKSPGGCRGQMLELGRKVLPAVAGEKYADAVVACLNGLQDEQQTGAFRDADNVEIGMAYITHVLKRLEDIVL